VVYVGIIMALVDFEVFSRRR